MTNRNKYVTSIQLNSIEIATIDRWLRLTHNIHAKNRSDLVNTIIKLIFNQIPKEDQFTSSSEALDHLLDYRLFPVRDTVLNGLPMIDLTTSNSEETVEELDFESEDEDEVK